MISTCQIHSILRYTDATTTRLFCEIIILVRCVCPHKKENRFFFFFLFLHNSRIIQKGTKCLLTSYLYSFLLLSYLYFILAMRHAIASRAPCSCKIYDDDFIALFVERERWRKNRATNFSVIFSLSLSFLFRYYRATSSR